MINFKPVIEALSVFLSIISFSMLLPMFVDVMTYNYDDAYGFGASSLVGLFFGVNIFISIQNQKENFTTKHAFILTTLSYVILPAFAALPFYFSTLKMNYTDAYFEAMSGIASCGATVIERLDFVPAGILVWRAMLNWLGGIGIIVLAMSVLPTLKIGGMQLFKSESSESDKILPRASEVAGATTVIYVVATLICAFLLWQSGMDRFDAVVHAMTGMATGGFANYDDSFNHFNNYKIEIIMIITMILSSFPFILYIQAFNGDIRPLLKDEQIRFFLFIILFATAICSIWFIFSNNMPILQAIRYSLFNLTSAITTTGYSIGDVGAWGTIPTYFMIILPYFGGCTGSTAGGIKVFRFQILYQVVITHIKQLIHPHGIFKSRYNDKFVSDSVANSVLIFFFTYIAIFIICVAILSYDGIDFFTSVKAVGFSLADSGLSIGGEYSSYKPLPILSKWVLIICMLLGRLELFTVLVLLLPVLWRKY